MDPEANIAEQLAIANRIVNDPDYPGYGDIYGDANRLSELVIEFHAWVRNGPPVRTGTAFWGALREGVRIVKDWIRSKRKGRL